MTSLTQNIEDLYVTKVATETDFNFLEALLFN